MKTKPGNEITKSTVLLFIFILCFQLPVISQKNSIKITPLKLLFERTNFSYEREIKEGLTFIADGQIWFVNDKEMEVASRLNNGSKPVLESNKGMRYSLEARGYDHLFMTDKNRISFYMGAGVFGGNHAISMVRESFQYITAQGSFWTNWATSPELKAEVNLISSGIFLDSGFQIRLGNAVNFDFGIIIGKAWTNQIENFLTLYGEEYYVLEEDRYKIEQNYSKNISGLYIEPMFTMGICF